jgi:nicotinate-nucleotide pyrophosphorylase (carboxylating)
MTTIQLPPLHSIAANVRAALAEDIGSGDLTAALIPGGQTSDAVVVCRENAVLCGAAWFDEVFHQVDPAIRVTWLKLDGETIAAGETLCRLTGPARSILTGERAALNFLQTLSGTATIVGRFVAAVKGTSTVILDTRKTIPGLRLAQKYAVRCGGAQNHRLGLYDGILIKENHIAAAGSIADAVRRAQATAPADVFIEVEVENLEQLEEAIGAGATRILLDNFDIAGIRNAVSNTRARAKLEVSGGVALESVRDFAETGVDYISIGALTKHVRAVDLSLRFV